MEIPMTTPDLNILVPLSKGDLTVLAWYAAWTPEVHQAHWKVRRAQPLNRSYAIGVGRLLESMISFGIRTRQDTNATYRKDGEEFPNPKYDTFNVVECRMTMVKAIGWWASLIDLYPHVAEAMPEFTAWMEDEKAVARWVANFDLGPEKFDRAADTAKMKADEAKRQARHVLQWIANKPGITVVYQGETVTVAEQEGSPDHVFVIIDGEDVEVPLTDLTLSAEAKAERDEHLKEARRQTEAMLAEMWAETA